MNQPGSPSTVVLDTESEGVTQLHQPDNCFMSCSAIALYEKEMERHRTTIRGLREALLREIDLLHHQNELLARSEVLAKEAEHRFLNGLQMVRSVLAMQSRSTDSHEAAEQLTIAAERVSTLSRINQHLHTIDALENVEFKLYLETLCHDFSSLFPDEAPPRSICVEGIEMLIPRHVATPLAFIASEIVMNSIKYATGKVSVNLQRTLDGEAVLSVSDDGPGLPQAFDPAESKGLGMQIISAFARQIQAVLIFGKSGDGTGARVSVRFKP